MSNSSVFEVNSDLRDVVLFAYRECDPKKDGHCSEFDGDGFIEEPVILEFNEDNSVQVVAEYGPEPLVAIVAARSAIDGEFVGVPVIRDEHGNLLNVDGEYKPMLWVPSGYDFDGRLEKVDQKIAELQELRNQIQTVWDESR